MNDIDQEIMRDECQELMEAKKESMDSATLRQMTALHRIRRDIDTLPFSAASWIKDMVKENPERIKRAGEKLERIIARRNFHEASRVIGLHHKSLTRLIKELSQ